jgi:uncharacterized flavoprotein (TIGR03862 family)
MQNCEIIIAGGGAAGLFAAEAFSVSHEVMLIEKQPAVGTKLLVAGRGGLNITNNCSGDFLRGKYSPHGWMDRFLADFDPLVFRKWLSDQGIPTFIGSSGKVFPEKGIHAVDVIKAIKKRLDDRGVRILTNATFKEFDKDQTVYVLHEGKEEVFHTSHLVLALGGASWPQTGSDGSWRSILDTAGIPTRLFQPSNCGINIQWPQTIINNHAGKPLKNIVLSVNNATSRGEAIITEYGLEGNAVYPLIPEIRKQLNNGQEVPLHIDFKPVMDYESLLVKVAAKKKTSEYASTLHLTSAQMALIKAHTTREQFLNPNQFIIEVKDLKIPVTSLRPVEEAISVVGGVPTDELNPDLTLKKYPWITVIGEMIDWDAPTGGFLLQGCFSMAQYAAKKMKDLM